MDIQKLKYLNHWLEYSSYTLSLENYVVLTNSLLVLQSENHFKKIFFWGIIQGLEADYYISFGYEKDAIAGRKYFYSDNCQNWKLLPVPQREHLVLTELCKRLFQGDPGLVVEVVDDSLPGELFSDQSASILEGFDHWSVTEEQREQNFEAVEVKEKSSKISNEQKLRTVESMVITGGEIKEEDRLAAIVHIITEEAAITPRGVIFKQTDGISVHSRAFEGIKLEDADTLCSYQHYRAPRNDCNTNLLIRCDYNYAIDFLDTIDKDLPSDCWSAQLVEGDRTIVLRNLHWPGLMFFHYLDSTDHGFIYVGQGQRNLDIPFMTQVTLPIYPVNETDVPSEEEENPRMSLVTDRSRPSKVSRPSARLSTSTKPGTTLSVRTEEENPRMSLVTDRSRPSKVSRPSARLSTSTKPGTTLSVRTEEENPRMSLVTDRSRASKVSRPSARLSTSTKPGTTLSVRTET